MLKTKTDIEGLKENVYEYKLFVRLYFTVNV